MNKAIARYTGVLISALILSACQSAYLEEPVASVQALDVRDTDGDGVINARDICADTPLNSEIDTQGCSQWVLEPNHLDYEFHFDFDSDTLKNEHASVFNAIAKTIQQYPNARIYIMGDTSSEGSNAYNHKLGMRRASIITNTLKLYDVDPSRILEFVYDEPILIKILQTRERRTVVRVVFRKTRSIPKWNIFTAEEQRKEHL